MNNGLIGNMRSAPSLPRPIETGFLSDASVDGIFERQAVLCPQAVALQEGEVQWTYQELNQRANQIARCLRAAGAQHESLVGICLERSASMIVGMLAVLKAGSAYVPINPADPAPRRSLMLSRVPLLLTTRELAGEFSDSACQIIYLDDANIAEASTENLSPVATGESLAYVIYTSGSTGRPKGVAVMHRGVIRLFCDPNFVTIKASDVVAQTLNVCFDASVLEIWGALLTGARLVILEKEIILSPPKFQRELERHGVTILMLTTAYFNLIARQSPGAFAKLNYVTFGGEPADPRTVAAVLRHGPPKHLLNAYGPTEASVVATCLDIREVPAETGSISIGRPIAGTTICLLDENLRLVRAGQPGEICIGGAAVARGYLNAPQLTAQRFIKDPFSHQPGARLYRTGDLARWLPDGTLDLIGRLDAQLKIRGFRIEPGEIESVLNQFPGAEDALVLARPNKSGESRLIAYVRGDLSRLKIAELRALLKAKLPEYMVPSAIVPVEEFPLSTNGKIDRDALPVPGVMRDKKGFVEPRNTLEAQLASLWQGVLEVDPIGITDDFFELGGDSLLAASLFVEIEKAFGKNLPLAMLLQRPTIEKLAAALSQEGWKPDWSPIVAVQPQGSHPPLFCVHGGFGGILFYGELARCLGTEQPLYGLQAEGLDGSPIHHSTIPSMAAYYVRQMRQVQPQGPYFLGGYSFGGVVAFEMAHQLYAVDQEVALLVLFDSSDYKNPPRRYSLVERIELDLQSQGFRLPAEKVQYLLQCVGSRLKGSLLQRFRRARDFFDQSKRLKKKSNLVTSSALEVVRESNRQALFKYQIRPYPGQITLFRAEDPDDGYIYPIDNGWTRYAEGGLQIYKIPGQHQQIFARPNVGVLAEKLEGCLRDARTKISCLTLPKPRKQQLLACSN
jgi:amino acid adenylation domain-containing protein